MVTVSLSSNMADRKLIASNDVTCKGSIWRNVERFGTAAETKLLIDTWSQDSIRKQLHGTV